MFINNDNIWTDRSYINTHVCFDLFVTSDGMGILYDFVIIRVKGFEVRWLCAAVSQVFFNFFESAEGRMNALIHNCEYRTDRPHYVIIFWNDQFARFEFQSIFESLDHTHIRCNPALEDDRFRKLLSLPDVALEISGHRIA